MKYDWLTISEANIQALSGICPPGEFRTLKGQEIPTGILPTSLSNKFDSVFVMASGTPNGNVVYMLNGNRVDQPKGEIDQQPFGIVLKGDGKISSGVLIQHGDWSERTIKPPAAFWDQVNDSGIGNYYPISIMPNSNSGRLEDLKISSQQLAFSKLVSALKDQSDL